MSSRDRVLFARSRAVLQIGCFLTAAFFLLSVAVFGILIIAPEEANFAGVLTRIDRATAERAARGALLGFLFMAPLMFVVLRILLKIIDTALTGDPFVHENGRRLRRVAWLLLALNLVWTVTFTWVNAQIGKAEGVSPPLFSEFSWSGWLTVVMLFVVARIFEYGSEMRAELQGTV